MLIWTFFLYAINVLVYWFVCKIRNIPSSFECSQPHELFVLVRHFTSLDKSTWWHIAFAFLENGAIMFSLHLFPLLNNFLQSLTVNNLTPSSFFFLFHRSRPEMFSELTLKIWCYMWFCAIDLEKYNPTPTLMLLHLVTYGALQFSYW